MKQLLIQLLGIFGLVPARRYRFLAGQLRDAESREKKLAKQVNGLEASASAWKDKASAALKQVKSKEEELARLVQNAEKFKKEVARKQRKSEELEALQKRLVEAQRDLAAAREHLMAVEVKLDILEGAANVLDVRTRDAIARAGETGAPV